MSADSTTAAFNTPRAAEFLALIERRLPEKTRKHSESVAAFMRDCADAAGITREQAVTAGLLHDLCKPMTRGELLEAAHEYGMDLDALERMPHTIWHGPVAAEECRQRLGIANEAVCDAIAWHTTGRPDWQRVGLALYLADFAEPRRTHPDSAEARRILAGKGFQAAVRYVAEKKIAHVAGKHGLDPTTIAFRDWIRASWPA